jgi:tRNA(Ile)-lysidine synthetase-like protein
MSDLLQTVRNTIDHHGLLPRGGTVVVGVSGGPDSLCLLHVLRALAPEYGVMLHLAHLNHQLRGADADEDAAFVQRLAAEWGLPFTVAARDVTTYAERERLAIEEAARQMRYGFLAEVAQQIGSEIIAVAHHADDQAESVLMHIIRGSGIAGLRGMRPKSEMGDMRLADLQSPISPLHLIRPLLYIPRADIEAYCAVNGLNPHFDVSNLDQTYFRNWLRHTVLPLLAQHNPGVRDVLCRTAEVAAADYDLLRADMERAWAQVARVSPAATTFDLAGWRALPLALKRATVRQAIHQLRQHLRNINFVHVERAVDVAERGTTGDRATLADGLMLTLAYDSFTIADESHAGPLPDWPLLEPGTQVTVSVPGVCALPDLDWALETQVSAIEETTKVVTTNPDPWTAYLDADACSGPLTLRTRLPGDRIAPQGMGGHTMKVNELMINTKTPRAARDRMPLLVCGERIAWACGLRVDEHARVTSATRHVLHLRFVRLVG